MHRPAAPTQFQLALGMQAGGGLFYPHVAEQAQGSSALCSAAFGAVGDLQSDVGVELTRHALHHIGQTKRC